MMHLIIVKIQKFFVLAACVAVIAQASAVGHAATTLAQAGQVNAVFSNKAGGKRSFYVSLPKNDAVNIRYKLVLVFPGTDTIGKEMKAFVGDGWGAEKGLESNMPNTIFVYPDPKWRFFAQWNSTDGGWLLGPYGGAARGMEDIYFVSELLGWLQKNYPIDAQQIFATGHSWGGDMTAVVGCFLGDKFRAIAPVAANRPYWFNAGNRPLNCVGNPAVWTFFGSDDTHFDGKEPRKGEFGREQNQFWLRKYSCSKSSTQLNIGSKWESIEYKNCKSTVRFSLYSPNFSGRSDQPGHQPPDWYLSGVTTWFNSF